MGPAYVGPFRCPSRLRGFCQKSKSICIGGGTGWGRSLINENEMSGWGLGISSLCHSVACYYSKVYIVCCCCLICSLA